MITVSVQSLKNFIFLRKNLNFIPSICIPPLQYRRLKSLRRICLNNRLIVQEFDQQLLFSLHRAILLRMTPHGRKITFHQNQAFYTDRYENTLYHPLAI